MLYFSCHFILKLNRRLQIREDWTTDVPNCERGGHYSDLRSVDLHKDAHTFMPERRVSFDGVVGLWYLNFEMFVMFCISVV